MTRQVWERRSRIVMRRQVGVHAAFSAAGFAGAAGFAAGAFTGLGANSPTRLVMRTTRSQADLPLMLLSTACCTLRIFSNPSSMRAAPALPCTQTHFISGFTSQWPLGRTPPQGPLRRVFGQFIGQDIPVEESTHCPHIW